MCDRSRTMHWYLTVQGWVAKPDCSEYLRVLSFYDMVHLLCLNEFLNILGILFIAVWVTALIVFIFSDQLHVSDSQVMVEFNSGNFKFIFHNPKNVSEFSMTLFKGHEKKEICALHVSKEKAIAKSNVTYCQAEHSNTSTTFILTNLERKHIDTYTYCLEMFLPPPYIDCRLKETYLYIQGKFTSLLPSLRFADKQTLGVATLKREVWLKFTRRAPREHTSTQEGFSIQINSNTVLSVFLPFLSFPISQCQD